MVRGSLAFALGIGIGIKSEAIGSWLLPQFWLLGIVVYLLTLKTSSWHSGWKSIGTFMFALFLLFIAGVIRSEYFRYVPQSNIGNADFYYATVREPTEVHEKYARTTLAISRIWVDQRAYQVNNGVVLYQRLDNHRILRYNQRLLVKGYPHGIDPPSNPYQFDYASYMGGKNIFWQHWVNDNSLLECLPSPDFSIRRWSYDLREHLINHLETFLPQGISLELTQAMLLGHRAAVNQDTEREFANSGTIHVLAVSGLHLGILYWILLQGFGKWRHHYLLKWLFTVSSLFVLWSFTLLTGLAASTQRAATMYSVLLIGQAASKQSNSVNTLSVAAMAIVWFNPYQLFSVGFQLSFLALVGILFLQPMIGNWLKAKNKLLNYCCQLMSVSLAAQLMVLPVSVYYFHQIPVYFLLANLLLVPLTFSIVTTGMVFFLFGLSESLSTLMAIPLLFLTKIAGLVVRTVADFPVSTLSNLYPEPIQVVGCYALLTTLLRLILTKNKIWWQLSVGVLTIMTFYHVFEQFQNISRKQLVVYHIPGHMTIDFIHYRKCFSLIHPGLEPEQSSRDYSIEPYRRYSGFQMPQNLVTTTSSKIPFDLHRFCGKRVLLIKDRGIRKIHGQIKLKSHITVVSANALTDLQQIGGLETELLIIDGSNRKSLALKLEKQARSMGIPVHNTWTGGYCMINL